MREIIYIDPGKYSDLKSDLITRNKIDAVRFEFTNVQVNKKEEVVAHDLKLYELNTDGTLKNGLALTDGIEDWDAEDLGKNYWELKNDFKDKRYCRVDRANSTVYLAALVEPGNNFVYDTPLEGVGLEIYFNGSDNPPLNVMNNITLSHAVNNLYDEQAAKAVYGLNDNTCVVRLFNERQAMVYCKMKVGEQTVDSYTKSISIKVFADTWSTNKMTSCYVLNSAGVAEPLPQNSDGTFDSIPQNIFDYPCSELTRYETKGAALLLHQQTAEEILTDFKHGRSSVQFELPNVELPLASTYGGEIMPPKYISSQALQLGDAVMLADKNKNFVGGLYKKSMSFSDRNTVRDIKIPKQYEITGIEYKYDGCMSYSIKAMEKPFKQAIDTALGNGQFHIELSHCL